jgi:hypothetical protein
LRVKDPRNLLLAGTLILVLLTLLMPDGWLRYALIAAITVAYFVWARRLASGSNKRKLALQK